jgi:hypothetical protein
MARPEEDDGWAWGLDEYAPGVGLGAAVGGLAGYGIDRLRPAPRAPKVTLPPFDPSRYPLPDPGSLPRTGSPLGPPTTPTAPQNPLNRSQVMPQMYGPNGQPLEFPTEDRPGIGQRVSSYFNRTLGRPDDTGWNLAAEADRRRIGMLGSQAVADEAARLRQSQADLAARERQLADFNRANPPPDPASGLADRFAVDRADLTQKIADAQDRVNADAASLDATRKNPFARMTNDINSFERQAITGAPSNAPAVLARARAIKSVGAGALIGVIGYVTFDALNRQQQTAVQQMLDDPPPGAPDMTADDLATGMQIYNQVKLGEVSLDDLSASDAVFLQGAAAYAADNDILQQLEGADLETALEIEEVQVFGGLPEPALDEMFPTGEELPEPPPSLEDVAALREQAAMLGVDARIADYNFLDTQVDAPEWYYPGSAGRNWSGVIDGSDAGPDQPFTDIPDFAPPPDLASDDDFDAPAFPGSMDTPAGVIDYDTGTFAGVSPEELAQDMVNRPRDEMLADIEAMDPSARGRMLTGGLGPYEREVMDLIEQGQMPDDQRLRALMNTNQPLMDDPDMPLLVDAEIAPGVAMPDVGDIRNLPQDETTPDLLMWEDPGSAFGVMDTDILGGPDETDGRILSDEAVYDGPQMSPIPLLTPQTFGTPVPYDFTGEGSSFEPYELGTDRFNTRADALVAGGQSDAVLRYNTIMEAARMLAGGEEPTEEDIATAQRMMSEASMDEVDEDQYRQGDGFMGAANRAIMDGYDFLVNDAVPAVSWGAAHLANPVVNTLGYGAANAFSAINGDGLIGPGALVDQIGQTYGDVNELFYPEDGSEGFNPATALGAPDSLARVPGMVMDAGNEFNRIRHLGSDDVKQEAMLQFLNDVEARNAKPIEVDYAADAGLSTTPQMTINPPISDPIFLPERDDEAERNIRDIVEDDMTLTPRGTRFDDEVAPDVGLSAEDQPGWRDVADTTLETLDKAMAPLNNLFGSPAEAGTDLTPEQIAAGGADAQEWIDGYGSALAPAGVGAAIFGLSSKIPGVKNISRAGRLMASMAIPYGERIANVPGDMWEFMTRNIEPEAGGAGTEGSVNPDDYPIGEELPLDEGEKGGYELGMAASDGDPSSGSLSVVQPQNPQLAEAAVSPETAPALATVAQQLEDEASELPDESRSSFVRRRMADWFGVTDPTAQEDLARALIMAGAHIAGSTSPILTSIAEGIAIGAQTIDDQQANRAAAEREALEQQIMLEKWAAEYDQRERQLAIQAARAQAALQEASDESRGSIEKFEDIDILAAEMRESRPDLSPEEAWAYAYVDIMGRNPPGVDQPLFPEAM